MQVAEAEEQDEAVDEAEYAVDQDGADHGERHVARGMGDFFCKVCGGVVPNNH